VISPASRAVSRPKAAGAPAGRPNDRAAGNSPAAGATNAESARPTGRPSDPATPKARKKIEREAPAQASAKRGSAVSAFSNKGRPRHFTFPRAIEAQIRAAAKARGVSSSCFVSALVQTVLLDDLVEAIFDGRSALELSSPLCRNVTGLTQMQAAFLYVSAVNAGEDGQVRLSAEALAAQIGAKSASSVFSLRHRLVELGLVRLGARVSGTIVPFFLTDPGRCIAAELAGSDFSTGGKA
jgi:hypothetical protein